MTPAGTPAIGIQFSSLPLGQIVPVFFFLIFFIWAIYTLVSAYHWFRYSGNLNVAIPMIAMHVIVSCLLAIYAVSGLAP